MQQADHAFHLLRRCEFFVAPKVSEQGLRDIRVCEFLRFRSDGPTCCVRAFRVRLAHQLETFESEHGLLNHHIFNLSLRVVFLFGFGNTIRFLRVCVLS